ncbi:dihydroorotase [Oceanibacterium hippocampi]|uniref:L-hydantoinase n=1 Tax=Oceanibacterium hippocampi TaxID=745714 RepID=A0A1Y5TQP9_9PROT|nr:dihydroorotase [Oceanibacterium hippocampi]SLN69866.1 L-hydantoinase [Oceanibacterium hippocampi]
MAETFDLIVQGGVLVTPNGIGAGDVGVRDGRIARIGSLGGASAAETIDAAGLHVLPGLIDSQVHFREPGLEHKEDLATGTAAAALGGIATVFEMPNTKPPTATVADIEGKFARAAGRAWTDHAFFAGATEANAAELGELERLPGVAGVKLFMGSSTGNLLVADDDVIREVLRNGSRRVAIHAEDEARLIERKGLAVDHPRNHPVWRDAESAIRATQRILALARETGRRVHVLHISTAEEMEILAGARDVATVEVTPQHLTLEAPDAYDRLGAYAQMNPPIRDGRHRLALWRAVRAGIADVMGSDHAPHTAEEKARPYPESPSGMPGVQTMLPLMLDRVNAGELSLERLVDLLAGGPARVYGVAGKGRLAEGYDGDLTLVDLRRSETIGSDWLASKCGWSPFEGRTVTGWPVATVVRGNVVMRDGTLDGNPPGVPVRFQESLLRG